MAQAQWIMAPELEPARRPSSAARRFDGGEGFCIRDCYDFVADGAVEGVGDEGDADAFDFVGAGFASLQDGALGFDGDGEDARVLLLEEARDAGEGAAGADAGDEGVNAGVHLLPEFDGGGVVVELGVGGVVKLEGGPDVGVGFGEGEARRMAPDMPSDSGVRWTSAPNPRMSAHFSSA